MSIFSPSNRRLTVAAYYSLRFKTYEMEPHRHPRCEIMYVLKGRAHILAENDTCTLGPGEFIFLDQDVPHRLTVVKEAPCTVINLEFACTPDEDGLDLSAISGRSTVFRRFLERPRAYAVRHDNGSLGYALKDLVLELEAEETEDRTYIQELLLSRMLYELAKCCLHEGPSAGLHYVRRAQQFIREHTAEDTGIDAVAAHVGIHKSYLQKLFRQYLQCSVTAYRNRTRLQKAAYLLQHTSLSVTDIAFEAGYNSRQHFGYTFERYYGMGPQQYRQQTHLNREVDTREMRRPFEEE